MVRPRAGTPTAMPNQLACRKRSIWIASRGSPQFTSSPATTATGTLCQYTQRQSNKLSVHCPANQIARLGAKVAVIAYSANPCRRMGGGRNFKAAIIRMGIKVPLLMPCRKRRHRSRFKSLTNGSSTASTAQVPTIHR
ncbi:hypothetical protein D3C72_1871970 [compost metagenome]